VRKNGEENNLNEAGRRVIASHYRGAARLAWFMPGSGVGWASTMTAARNQDSRLACEFQNP